MINWDTIQKIESVRKRAHELGFKLERYSSSAFDSSNEIVLRPRDEELPAFIRDADITVGDLHSIDLFLRGIMWHRDYMGIIRAADSKRIEKCEQTVRNANLVRRLKDEPVAEIG